MVVRLSTKTDFVIELIRDGKLVDATKCQNPAACAQQAAILIARVGELQAGDIILVRDFE
jgi:hypothetical protein